MHRIAKLALVSATAAVLALSSTAAFAGKHHHGNSATASAGQEASASAEPYPCYCGASLSTDASSWVNTSAHGGKAKGEGSAGGQAYTNGYEASASGGSW